MTKESKSSLYDLHSMIADSREGYAKAARHAKDEHVSGFLRVLSAERQNIGTELGRLLPGLGTDALSGNGTLLGGLHRAWMQLNAAMGTKGNAAVLEACGRGEKVLLLRYDELLSRNGLTLDVRQVLQSQRALIKDQAERVGKLQSQFQKFDQKK